MPVIRFKFLFAHLVQLQLFPRLVKSGRSGIVGYFSCVKIIYPFFERTFCHAVKIVHFQNVILRIQLAHGICLECLFLERSQFKNISFVYPFEFGFSVIHIIFPMTEREIHDVDAIYFSYFLISLSSVYVFSDQF